MLVSWILSGILLIFAYLWGSIPTGYLAGRYLQGIDIRQHGSGSTGMTNVLRTLGKKAAIATLAIDLSKGVMAVAQIDLFYNLISADLIPVEWKTYLIILAAIGAILGHSKSIWIGFTGGKSVAASLGAFLALDFRIALLALGIFGLCLAISRIVSLSSISAAIGINIGMFIFDKPFPYIIFGLVASAYVIYLHRSNIKRLVAGVEPKIGEKLQENT
ncbi:MAG: glycerol-3-phosphate 1-O-acyltransferase PlsY [Prochloraceae cyanobacterium]|nr:glycerol-3-phosphate 1-O-acyltransferase PlsY [Prochloraceae cyanobacterium]